MTRRIIATLILLLWSLPAPAEGTQKINENDMKAAIAAFTDWTNAYVAGDYAAQYQLTDPRIRRWHSLKRWQKVMRKARKRNGLPTRVDIRSVSVMTGDKLPCTEMRHCYPEDLQAVVLILDTSYPHAQPVQPEFAVMVPNEGGWRLGGGTFPSRPFGETMVILNRQDERKYQPGQRPQ